jgi:alpha-tubulin suppressor-like RCC1 family protein
LGDNNKPNDDDEPVQVKGENGVGNLEDIVAISAGDYFAMALDEDGYVWAWGNNWCGQLGQGNTTPKSTPVKVKHSGGSALSDIIYIDAGYYFALAVDKYGTVWVWGDNSDGQLGQGNTSNDEYSPVEWPQ